MTREKSGMPAVLAAFDREPLYGAARRTLYRGAALEREYLAAKDLSFIEDAVETSERKRDVVKEKAPCASSLYVVCLAHGMQHAKGG